MLNRVDPFFQRVKPHKNGYLESLHRTYGEPRSALPIRNDALFERAYQFRQREKAHYSELEQAHNALQSRYDELVQETARIQTLVEQLSKPTAKDELVRTGSGADSSGDVQSGVPSGDADPRSSDEGVAKPTKARARGGNRKRAVRVADSGEDAGQDTGRRGGATDEVRDAGDGDVGGPSTEHPSEGPKSGGGAGPSEETPDPGDGGEEAAE